jgi:hypothetical protein
MRYLAAASQRLLHPHLIHIPRSIHSVHDVLVKITDANCSSAKRMPAKETIAPKKQALETSDTPHLQIHRRCRSDQLMPL